MNCKNDNCEGKVEANGICRQHLNKEMWLREKKRKEKWFAAQPEDTLAAAVIRYAVAHDYEEILFRNAAPQGDCLVWQGSKSQRYGSIGIRVYTKTGSFSHPVLVHRLAYALKDDLPESQVGPKNDTPTINHKCFNNKCVNPDHLELMSLEENNNYGSDFHAVISCHVCSTDFKSFSKVKKYCSPNCARLAWNARQRGYYAKKKAAVS